ncbi:MAG TPA: BTAD domain-containing putative transcriptional regulator [Acidimicrobiales bacterium]
MTLHAATRTLTLRLLGGFAVWGSEGEIVLPASAQRVVAYLALQDRPVHRRRLAGVLWPETDDGRAAANLRSVLWRARKLAPLIRDDRSSIALSPDVDTDARRLRQSGEDGVLAWLRTVPGGAAADLELLPDWYDDWVVAERERYRQIVLRRLNALAPRLAARGRVDEAVEVALHAVGLEPLSESSHRSLITALLAAGDRAGAVRQYLRCEAVLRDELGLAPSEATIALVRPLLPVGARRVLRG